MGTCGRSGSLALTVVLAFALASCGEDEPPPAAPRGPPPASELATVDLCGGSSDTTGYFREYLREGGPAAVIAWLRQNVVLPANLDYCDRAAGSQALTQAVRVTVHRLLDTGAQTTMLYEAGTPLPDLPLGVRNLAFNVYPEGGGDTDGVRITIHYHGG